MRIAAVFASAALICAASGAQAGDIAGTVYDSRGRPAADVLLTIDELGMEAVTAHDGSYRFSDVVTGDHRIAIMRGAQPVQRISVHVAGEGDAARNIVMISATAMRSFQAATLQDDGQGGEEAFAEAIALAEQMVREAPASDAQAWRWRDLDG